MGVFLGGLFVGDRLGGLTDLAFTGIYGPLLFGLD